MHWTARLAHVETALVARRVEVRELKEQLATAKGAMAFEREQRAKAEAEAQRCRESEENAIKRMDEMGAQMASAAVMNAECAIPGPNDRGTYCDCPFHQQDPSSAECYCTGLEYETDECANRIEQITDMGKDELLAFCPLKGCPKLVTLKEGE